MFKKIGTLQSCFRVQSSGFIKWMDVLANSTASNSYTEPSKLARWLSLNNPPRCYCFIRIGRYRSHSRKRRDINKGRHCGSNGRGYPDYRPCSVRCIVQGRNPAAASSGSERHRTRIIVNTQFHSFNTACNVGTDLRGLRGVRGSAR